MDLSMYVVSSADVALYFGQGIGVLEDSSSTAVCLSLLLRLSRPYRLAMHPLFFFSGNPERK
jgi:hypothetical protein